MSSYRIAVIEGDGIGKEVVPAAIEVLDALGTRYSYSLEYTMLPWSCEYFTKTGRMMPDDGLDQLARFDAIFLGAVGFPGVADHVSLWGLLIPIRRTFHQYANVRPVRSFPGVPSPLRDELVQGLDVVVVRENNEGEYSEIGGRLYRGSEEELCVQQSTFTRRGTERIVRYAFELARTRRSHLLSATKSNGIIHTMPFWDEIVEEQSALYPDVTTEKMHIDALVAEFVRRPTRLDVVVGSNLFGDILSDLAGGVAGSIGIAPSANLDPTRTYPSMFEPVHGSAPDIAGREIANPIGQIWSGAMMLAHLGETDAADAIESAIANVLANGAARTADLGGNASTKEVTDEFLRVLRDA